MLSETLTLYHTHPESFEFSARTDIPFLAANASPSGVPGRGSINLSVLPEKLRKGRVRGFIVVVTNDPEFPRLVVPVKATVQGDS